MIRIVLYQEKYKLQIKELISRLLHDIFKVLPMKLDDLDNIPKKYFSKKGIFYVALSHDIVVGTVGVNFRNKHCAVLKRLYVDPNYRSQGVSYKLLNKAFKFCRDKGCTKMVLSTYPQMDLAIKFYERNGFKKYYTVPKSNRMFYSREL